jgi:hypothetical protein
MKHLIDIKNFLLEALTPVFQEKYKKHFDDRPKEVVDRLNKLLDNKERVYIPYNSNTISETQLKVKSFLEELGYNISDYKLNQAVQIENNKRQIRISKLLAKNPELLKEFTLDDTRANTRIGSEFSIVLTSNYEDVAGMSFDRCWTNSCLDIKYGENGHYVKDEVKQGTVVAYLIKSDDLNVEEPLGRVNIKPYYNVKEDKEVIYVLDRRVYGNVPDEKLFKSIISSYLKEKQEIKNGGFFKKEVGLYSDEGSPEMVLINKDYSLCYGRDCVDEEGYNRQGYDKEGYNREGYDRHGISKTGDYPYQDYLTREQFRFLKDSIRRGGTFVVDENGLVNVEGDVNFYDQILEKIPVKFGVVTGDFNCPNNDLISLEGAPNSVGGGFKCSGNKLTSLKGVPTSLGGSFDCENNNLTSLEGAPQIIKGLFDCGRNKLTSLKGAPKETSGYFNCAGNDLISLEHGPIKVGGSFTCYENKLTSLKGAPITVGSGFDCSRNNLISLEGAPEYIPGGFSCNYNSLISLEGAPKETERSFSCEFQTNGHFFTREDVLAVCKVGLYIYV